METSTINTESTPVFDQLSGPKPIVDIVNIPVLTGSTYEVDRVLVPQGEDPRYSDFCGGYGPFIDTIAFPEDDNQAMFRAVSKDELVHMLMKGYIQSTYKDALRKNETNYMKSPELVWIESRLKEFGESRYLVEVRRPAEKDTVHQGHAHNILLTDKPVPITDVERVYEVRVGSRRKEDGRVDRVGYRDITPQFKSIAESRVE
jgi:hypothetical protein